MLPDLKISGYDLQKLVHQGTNTVIYRAVSLANQQSVILKILNTEYPTLEQITRFKHEYQMTLYLDSEHTVKVYRLETHQNCLVLILEDFNGVSLKQWMASSENVNNVNSAKGQVAQFLNIAVQLASSLVYLHHNRIIHKDIKPSNIIINPQTKQVKIADFSIASRLNKETPHLKNPDRLEGTLAYMSPEQTGRMNRAVDYRSDFYSLGITFYELLTGQLPFQSTDPLELVHCHIAKQPQTIQQLNPQIPLILAQIVTKLMAKNAEHRYQSAAGLLADLERCQNQMESVGKISNFIPGQLDAMSQLLIPQKLYGREEQIEQLLQVFDRVSQGSSEIVLVGGYSGIGKSVLVQEILRNLTRQRGYFISGKFDQFKRNVPYASFNQALRNLVQQILMESQTQLAQWRETLLNALGANARVAIDAIPELELILGHVPPVPELGAIESQNRFNRVMQKFLQAVATAEHPLVMFMDDCQWMDAGTVNLYQHNCLEKTPYLLNIMAYRDNEVSPTHPLCMANEAIRAAGIPMSTITLKPLENSHVTQLIAETLSCAAEDATPLANLLVEKTDGNPFFLKQLLRYLHQNKWLNFHAKEAQWQWDIQHIYQQNISENVVDLMVEKIKCLSAPSQRVLQLAACIDNQFSLNILSIACEQSLTQTARDLWEALQVGLILPYDNTYRVPQVFEQQELENLGKIGGQVRYKFLHDRVQQAAYVMIPDAQKQPVHLRLGRLLLQGSNEAELQENIFDIVNHLNFARGLIANSEELYELAQLNLKAGKTAIAASAFETALSFFQVGCECLPALSWEHNYSLTFALYLAMGEAEYLNAHNDEALAIFDLMIPNTHTLLEQCLVNELKMTCLRMKNNLPAAYSLGIKTLQALGIEFESHPDDAYLARELAKTKDLIADRPIADLANLPTLTDPLQLAAHRILKELFPIAYFTRRNAQFLCSIKFVQATIEHGNCRLSVFGYMLYAFTLVTKYREIESGREVGKLSLDLYERWNVTELGGQILNMWGCLTLHYMEYINECKPFMLKSFNIGIETGAYQWSGYAAMNYLSLCFFGNESLQTSAELIEQFIPTLEKFDRNMFAYLLLNKKAIHQLTLCSANAEDRKNLIDEKALLDFAESSADSMTSFMVYLYKLTLANWFGEVDKALEYANTGVNFLSGAAGVFHNPVFRFHRAIALAAACTDASDRDRQIYRQQLEISLAEFQDLAENCPANYQHKYFAIRAEIARLSGNSYEAGEYYDGAIALAMEKGFIQDAALVNELAARFYRSQNRLIFVKSYLNEARFCYLQWGATAKVSQLEQYYANLFPEAAESRIAVTASTSSHANILDLATVIKSSQAISSEIVLEKLLTKLLHIILENAGAETGCIILERDGQMFVEVSDNHDRDSGIFHQSILLEESSDVPISMIKYVARTQQPLVLSDADRETFYQSDIYLQNCQPKSILCAPILYQGKSIGIVYLENNLAAGAFTRDRLELLQMLTAQAAIAIENARLYAREQDKSRQLAESLQNLQQFQIELAQKEEQYRSIFEAVADGISLIELETGKIRTANPALCQILGYSQSEFLHLTPADYIHPDYLHLFDEFQETIRSRQEFNCQAVIQKKDGRLCDIETKANFFEYEGKPHALVINRDISDRKRAEKALQTSESQLRQKAEDLEAILMQLQQTQAQLVQTEKISQLGQLVAGVAHEVNNPVSFISGNLYYAKQYADDLINLVKLYQDKFPQPGAEIVDKIEAIELDYLLKDLPKMIESMKLGTDRIRDIMESLRNYSRTDGVDKKSVNIHQGIETTLMILSHRLKANSVRPAIKIIKNYGDLPKVECYPGQLNQVFMNLIANAIDALEESNMGKVYQEIENHPNIITISTSVDRSQKLTNPIVKIQIVDNGIGMPEAVTKQLFSPFFTTKVEGKGTGLGLSISHQIVTKKHGGSLKCFSSGGRGTEFAIALPIDSIPIKAK